MKGRRPKSVAQQIAAGDPRKVGVHKLEERLKAEPKARSGVPCPAHLKGLARERFLGWAEDLEYMELDKRPDAAALEAASLAYARAVEADLTVEREGLFIETFATTKDGEKVRTSYRAHPAVGLSFKAWNQVRHFVCEFGFTPLSRTRLSMERKPTKADDLAALLAGPRKRDDEKQAVQ